MAITVKSIVNEIEENMNQWRSTHSAFHARQVLTLVGTFIALYGNQLITQHTYDFYKDYVYSCSVEVSQYYKNNHTMPPF